MLWISWMCVILWCIYLFPVYSAYYERSPAGEAVKTGAGKKNKTTDEYNGPRVSRGLPPGSIIFVGSPSNITGHLLDLCHGPPSPLRLSAICHRWIYGYIRWYRWISWFKFVRVTFIGLEGIFVGFDQQMNTFFCSVHLPWYCMVIVLLLCFECSTHVNYVGCDSLTPGFLECTRRMQPCSIHCLTINE
jgi:hypothetical protein